MQFMISLHPSLAENAKEKILETLAKICRIRIRKALLQTIEKMILPILPKTLYLKCTNQMVKIRITRMLP